MTTKHRITISFKESELELFLHVKAKRNFSDYVKDLIEEDMRKQLKKSNLNVWLFNGS